MAPVWLTCHLLLLLCSLPVLFLLLPNCYARPEQQTLLDIQTSFLASSMANVECFINETFRSFSSFDYTGLYMAMASRPYMEKAQEGT